MKGEYVHALVDMAGITSPKMLSAAFEHAVTKVAEEAASRGMEPVWNQVSLSVEQESDNIASIADGAAIVQTYHTLNLSVLAVK